MKAWSQYKPLFGNTSQTSRISLLFLLNHLGNYTNFYHFTVILLFRFYSDDGRWNVRSKY